MDVTNKGVANYFLHTNIRALRKRKDWSQEELAIQVGLNRGNIASYENGTAEPKICNLLKLAHLFDVSLLSLVQNDFRNEATLELHQNVLRVKSPSPEMMEPYLDKAIELQKVMDGLNICCRYKVKMMDGNLPKEMQLVALHFEELYETAQALLQQHLTLLQGVHPEQNNRISREA